MIAFQTIPESEKAPNGYQYYMVFDIEMENFYRKACLMAWGHIIHTLDIIAYSTVVTR